MAGLMQLLKMTERGLKNMYHILTRDASHSLIMRTEISSKPCALLMSRDCNIFIMLSSIKVITVILAFLIEFQVVYYH